MSVATMLGGPGPWTLHDLERLPEDGLRYELVGGALLVSPAPSRWHQAVARRLFLQLAPQAGPSWEATLGLAVEQEETLRIPDLTLVRAGLPARSAPSSYHLDDFGLLVEVVSPSSRSTDRLVKPVEYAAAGVPFYWRVETEQPELVAYRLQQGSYVEEGRGTTGRLEAAGPCPLVVDLDDLFRD